MSNMFAYANNFNSIPTATPNTSKVTGMGSMFSYASTFNQNIGSWDTSNVTSMTNMFYVAQAFNN